MKCDRWFHIYSDKRGLKLICDEVHDVRENVKGQWLSKNLDNFRKYEVICSVCGARFIGNYDAYDEPYDFNFCPNCGAHMMRGES